MAFENSGKKSESAKDTYRKKGIAYLIATAVIMVFYLAVFSLGMKGGIILSFIALAMVLCLLASIFYFLKALLGK